MHFSDKLAAAIKTKNSCLMLGLDPNWDRLPEHLKGVETLGEKASVYEAFCIAMVAACADKVCGIKIQMGYFEALGSVGVKAVENIIAHARTNYPDLIVMIDAKRGDIGSTSEAYAEAFLGKSSPLSGDCVTVAPYMGTDSLEPFIAKSKEGKGLFLLAKTSNKSSSDLQDQMVVSSTKAPGSEVPVYMHWTITLAELSNKFGLKGDNNYPSLGIVVGATNPDELKLIHGKFKEKADNIWVLAPGVGAQGGKIEDVLKIRDGNGLGILIPVSRAVLYAGHGEDYLEAAQAKINTLWEAQKL